MSAVPNPNLPEYEQTCLAGIAAEERNLRFCVESFGARPDHSADEINALINDLNAGHNRLQFHNAPATYLYQLGRPYAWQQLSRLLADLQQAINIYREMYQSKLQFMNNLSNMHQQAQQTWVNTVHQAAPANQAAADKQFKQWNALFTRSCATCGYSLGDLYHKLEICPSCGMLLRR